MDELHDAGFLFRLPLWMVIHQDPEHWPIPQVPCPTGDNCFPLFTDQDLAERFRAAIAALKGYDVRKIETQDTLLVLLDVLKGGGFHHVVFDQPGKIVAGGTGPPPLPIDALRLRIRPGG